MYPEVNIDDDGNGHIDMSIRRTIRIAFRESTYFVTNLAAELPVEAFRAFHLEQDLRRDWWQIKSGDVVIDVGAGVGPYTLTALAAGAVCVVAFEPNKEQFFNLCQNLILNGWSNRCQALGVLACNQSGGMGSYYPQSSSPHREAGKPELRAMTTIDRVVSSIGFNRVDWLKVDTEGFEPFVIEGAIETLTKFKPTIITENHVAFAADAKEQIASLLLPLGYVEVDHRTGEGANENWSLWKS